MNTLERRVERLEHRAKPKELRAVIQGLITPPGPDDPRLRARVDDEGKALVSPWWSVWFFEGTKEQQEARLKQLRLHPEFQKPCSHDEIPVRFEGGATCEDVYARLEEEERESREKTERES